MSTGLNIDLNDHIGAIHFNCVTGEVSIVGASDERNKAFNARTSNSEFNERFKTRAELEEYLKDAIELTNAKKTPITSENYEDFRKPTKPMPKHCYGTAYGQQEQKRIEQKLKDYYLSDSVTKEDLKKFFKDRCKDMRVTMAQESRTTGTDQDHNRQIILDTYEIFRMANSVMANLACDKEGERLARENGWKDGEDRDWVYYNADFYYESEELRDIFREAAKEIAGEWKCGDIDTSERDMDSLLSYSSSFHQVWKNGSENGARICSMINISEEPPEGFYLFFRASVEKDSHVGILQAGTEEKAKINEKIIFNKSGIYEQRPQFYHLSDFLKNGDHADSSFERYIKNFDIYTRYYGTAGMRK